MAGHSRWNHLQKSKMGLVRDVIERIWCGHGKSSKVRDGEKGWRCNWRCKMLVVFLIGPSYPLRISECPYAKGVGRGPISKTIFWNSSTALGACKMLVVLLIGPSYPVRISECPYVKSVGRGPISKTIFWNSNTALGARSLLKILFCFGGNLAVILWS